MTEGRSEEGVDFGAVQVEWQGKRRIATVDRR
jgi:hypothetical protein